MTEYGDVVNSNKQALDTMWQDNATPYASSSQNGYYGAQQAPYSTPLQFYNAPDASSSQFDAGSRRSVDGQMGSGATGYGGNIQPVGGWWHAFVTGGFEGEPPLLEGCARYDQQLAC